MFLSKDSPIIIPSGSVVIRAGQVEQLRTSDVVHAKTLHNEEVVVVEGGVRSRNGMYAELEGGVPTTEGLAVSGGETVFVLPWVAVQLVSTVPAKQGIVKYPPSTPWDAIMGTSLIVGASVFIGVGLE